MASHPKLSFKNPVTRPRLVIWIGVWLAVICLLMVVAVGATSSYWFCAEICHSVQDDSIVTYQRSSHSKVSCIACHMPANADPVTFLLHKVEALGELPPTILGTYTEPLNPESEVSLSKKNFPDTQCTQCHDLATRQVSPSAGIIIDHTVHTDSGVRCTFCHNRVAHNESDPWQPTLVTPKTGEKSVKHANYMTMTACYRCHGLEAGSPASGECKTCHPANFQLKPKDHQTATFMGQHGKMALEEDTKVKETVKETGIESPTAADKTAAVDALEQSKDEKASHDDPEYPVAPLGTINRCYTCHNKAEFCDKCHGTPMPHAQSFLKNHGKEAKDKTVAATCNKCHGDQTKTQFCTTCHHGTESKWTFDKNVNWTQKQHAQAVAKVGVKTCTERCHDANFCSSCHNKLANAPASHKKANFTYPANPTITQYGKEAAKVTAGHATEALKSTELCAICHGTGGVNAQFCKDCHGMNMPHDDTFKKFHSKSKPGKCVTCHRVNEVCSDCHHVGYSLTKPWMKQHGISVNKNGYDTCIGKCHNKEFCTTCHMKKRVIPASHKANGFVKGGAHAKAYDKDAEVCTFCHAGDAKTLPNSTFCKNCHKLDMPHAIDDGSNQKFLHKDQFKKKEFKKATCYNCHSQTFCNNCHHKQSKPGTNWMTYHPNIVKKDGSDGCYECHDALYCANCHVNLNR